MDSPYGLTHLDNKIRQYSFLKAEGVPQYMLIDKNGIIAEKHAPTPDSEEIIEKINQLLKQP
jgi:hypothetical protein